MITPPSSFSDAMKTLPAGSTAMSLDPWGADTGVKTGTAAPPVTGTLSNDPGLLKLPSETHRVLPTSARPHGAVSPVAPIDTAVPPPGGASAIVPSPELAMKRFRSRSNAICPGPLTPEVT